MANRSGAGFYVDFDEIFGIAQRSIHRAALFMGYGVNAAQSLHPISFELNSESPFSFGSKPEDLQPSKDAFKVWIIHNGLRELVELFGQYMNAVYAVCSHRPEMTQHEFEKKIEEFKGIGELRRLKKLRTLLKLPFEKVKHVTSFIRVRNSITHAGGFADADLDVRWVTIRAFYVGPDGQEREVHLPLKERLNTRNGGQFRFEFPEACRTISKGEQITFAPAEVHAICATTYNTCKEIGQAAVALLETRGVLVKISGFGSFTAEMSFVDPPEA